MLRFDPRTSRGRNCTIKNTLELWNVQCCLKVKSDLNVWHVRAATTGTVS